MTKEETFNSLKNLKKPVIVHMYKNLYEDREELLEKHQTVLKNWENKIKKLEKENAKLQEQLENAMKIPDDIMNFIIDCTYVRELDYNNINDYVNKLKAEAQKYLGNTNEI